MQYETHFARFEVQQPRDLVRLLDELGLRRWRVCTLCRVSSQPLIYEVFLQRPVVTSVEIKFPSLEISLDKT